MAIIPFYLSRRVVTANEFYLTATVDGGGPFSCTVDAGTYYLDGNSTDSLVGAVDAALEAGVAGENFTVTYSTTTGKVSIACTTLAITWTVTFGSTALRDWLGFTTGWAGSGASPQTGTNIAQGQLFAGSARAKYKRIRGRDQSFLCASSGLGASVSSGDKRYSFEWVHGFEPGSGAAVTGSGTLDDAGTVVPWTWEDFMDYHIESGQPFRYYASAGTAVLSYSDTFELNEKSRGEFSPEPVEDGSDQYFRIPLHVNRFVGT